MRHTFAAIGLVWLALSLTGCGATVQLTPQGTPRKVIIRKNDTPLFTSSALDQVARTARQWEAYFVYEVGSDYYHIGSRMGASDSELFYVRADEIYEWNSRFVINYTTSPDQTNRAPLPCYQTLEGAQRDDGPLALIEKPSHRTNFVPTMDPEPILKDFGDDLYHIASLYDDIGPDGTHIFLGNFAFCYKRFISDHQQIRRYIHKAELDAQIKRVFNAFYTTNGRTSMAPDEVTEMYQDLLDLLFDQGNKNVQGIEDIRRALGGDNIPSAVEQGPFDANTLEGNNTPALSPQLAEMHRRMVDYLNHSENWNEHGFGYVPTEWIPEH